MNNPYLFINAYEKASYIERLAFRNFTKLYNLFTNDNVLETHYGGNDVYDYLITRKKDNGYKRLIIEIKVRDKIHPTYIYENKKHKSLSKVKAIDSENNTILYINMTPNGTYVWNIDKIISKYKLVDKEMNKATMTSTTDKENKKCYLLNTEDAKHYEYRWDYKQFNEEIEKEKMIEKQKQDQLNDDICLFRILTKKL